MKIGIYSPYLDTLGGGERYVLTLAEHWSYKHRLNIFWDDAAIVSRAETRFDLDLSRVHIVPNIFTGKNFISKLFATAQYDCLFILSDGSVPATLARRNILHFQVPFRRVSLPWWKAFRYARVVCNSEFTKNNLDPGVNIPTEVIYPPVAGGSETGTSKTHTILSVGRFSPVYGAKKQNILIDAFMRAQNAQQLSGWKLILAGGLLDRDRSYLDGLKAQARGYHIEFYPNCTHQKLQSLYQKASIYWHAAGFGQTKPEYMEHFGIATVEAMSTGCIPVVFSGGGQPEIVRDGINGFLWSSESELLEKTVRISGDATHAADMRLAARTRAGVFSKKRFTQAFDRLLLAV